MTLPIPYFRSAAAPAPAIARAAAQADGQWGRWVFKAPPLEVEPPAVDLRELSVEIQNRLSVR